MSAYADRVHETTTTTGTGPFTLGGATTGCQSFATAYPSGSALLNVCITDGTNWETVQVLYAVATGLTVIRVFESSNSGAAVSFGAGSKDVFVTVPGHLEADLGTSLAFVMRIVPR
jgi:hypothetical protein